MASHYFYVNRYKDTDGTTLRINAPIQVRNCGHFVVDKNFRDKPMKKNFLELFWGVQGGANIGFQGKVFHLRPKTVFFYLPGDFHDITTYVAPLEYHWFTLDGENLANLIEQFRIRQEIIQTDICPINLFRQLQRNMQEQTIRGEYLAGATAYHILSLAMAGEVKERVLFESFRNLIQSRFGDPSLRINEIADKLSVHRSTLNRCLESVSGVSPGEYLLAFRMQEALQLIKNSNWPLKKILLRLVFPTRIISPK